MQKNLRPPLDSSNNIDYNRQQQSVRFHSQRSANGTTLNGRLFYWKKSVFLYALMPKTRRTQ